MQHRNELSEFIHYRTYARWLDEEGRRETYEEAIYRYLEFMDAKSKARIPGRTRKLIEDHLLRMATMPSMRSLWAAGPSLSRNNICGYNCAYLPIRDIDSFSELMYILMNGTGVGYSVERQYVEQLPPVKPLGNMREFVQVLDSKEGWADSVRQAIIAGFNGVYIDFDYSNIRPEGARLKTSGGRASWSRAFKIFA